MTQQTRCRRCPPQPNANLRSMIVSKSHPFSYMLTYGLCINDRYDSVKIVFSYLFTYILMPCWLKSSFFTYVLFMNDQRKYVKRRHFLIYILTICLRQIETNWQKSSFSYLFTLTYCEQSTQVGKKSTFLLTYLHTYVLLVKVVFLTYVLSAIDRRKFVQGRHFTYLLTCLLMSCILMIDTSR